MAVRPWGAAAIPARLWAGPAGVLALVGAPIAALLIGRLLPEDGAGLALRLAAAGACLLLVPGALILRAVGRPDSLAVAVAGSLALSLGLAFVAFAVTFAVNGTLTLALGIVAAAAAAAAVPAARRRVAWPPARDEAIAVAAVVGAALVFAGLVWWVVQTLGTGDVLFHLARARKLAEADVWTSVGVANEFKDGGLHPGYAFPLWHGELAALARLAGVDVADVVVYLPAVLVPIAFVVAYAAGVALFRSWPGGIAVLAAHVAQLGFSRGGTGSFTSIALPASLTRVVLVPALLALAFAFLASGRKRELLPLAAAALAVAVIHPTYLLFVTIPLAGFALVRLVLASRRREEAPRLGLMLAALAVPGAAFFAWLLPTIADTASHQPTAGEEARAIAHYGDQLDVIGDAYRAAPTVITRAGPVVIAALLAVPILALVARRRWSAFAVGGTVAALAVLLVPEVFARFSDLVSISQSRRLAQFLPVPFAVAGAALLLGRLKAAGVALAAAAGTVLELVYVTEVSHAVETPGPAWPVWVALAGGTAGLAAGAFVRRRFDLSPDPTRWAAAAGVAFVIPIGAAGLAGVERADAPDQRALTPGLVDALRRLDDDDVVFAHPNTSYRVAALAPVYVAALPASHVADTEENRPYRRQRDAIRFFAPAAISDAERRSLLETYEADWLLVDKAHPYPRKLTRSLAEAYADHRFALFRVSRR